MTTKQIFLVIIFFIIIILIYIIKNKKEYLIKLCDITNCGDIKTEKECLNCENCGVYTDRRNYKYCINGDKNGPTLIKNWKIWQYSNNPTLYQINSPSTKLYDEYSKYLGALDKIYNDTPQPIIK